MAKPIVFVDGAAGTTGLRIHQRLAQQQDVELLTLPETRRKSLKSRLKAVRKADVSILCLPDDAAKELVAAAPADARICDTSTAHRTDPNWVYGFAELPGQRQRIAKASRVAVPGCHATGFLALVAPLVQSGILPPDTPLCCHSITGYSGGGKAMIASYQDPNRPASYDAPRQYGLTFHHKHLPEMQAVARLSGPPLFTPVVADYYSGMLVTVPIRRNMLAEGRGTVAELSTFFTNYYFNERLTTVYVVPQLPADGFLAANALAGKDIMEIYVMGNEDSELLLLAARYDNLGKGASGAALQCLNLMLGRSELVGLQL